MDSDFGGTARADLESAERIDEALMLQISKGSSVAAWYLEFHGISADTALRVLISQQHRPAQQFGSLKKMVRL